MTTRWPGIGFGRSEGDLDGLAVGEERECAGHANGGVEDSVQDAVDGEYEDAGDDIGPVERVVEVEENESKCLKNYVEEEEGFVESDAELFFGGESEEDVGGP